ncbi:helix-turn-helix domain-containing protein [Gelria sp. Kuro-4]|uniref:helix-turn-helix domain-containing protein n=1 Tax=Gelria sp. Kuro-4 TaxID=2796927 RepID=UPI001BF000FB|nr:helix-turn-helix transcriptional regulator [Gelria sp. Kuro-4]BCV23812.1 transcriptional regulator [Gelria sp. Kuro-4]
MARRAGGDKGRTVCGRKLKAAREARGLSLSALAAAARVSSSYLSEVEHGRKSPSLPVLRRLAAALNLAPADLIAAEARDTALAPGERVRLLREEKGLTLSALAEKAGITTSYLSEIERGQAGPALTTLERLAQALGTTLAQLWGPLAGLGLRLRELREERGLSQAELAARAGVSPGLVGQVERGEVQPSLATLEGLAAGLGVSPCHLIREEDPAALYARLSPCVRELLADRSVQAVLERLCTCSPAELRFLLAFIDLYKTHHRPGAGPAPATETRQGTQGQE